MAALLEILRLYGSLAFTFGAFFFGRFTKGLPDTWRDTCGALLASIVCGVIFPWIIWNSLTSTPNTAESGQ